jgi:hypothetical protein
VKPVVMETDDGDAVIWMVDTPDAEQDKAKKPPEEAPLKEPTTGKQGEL